MKEIQTRWGSPTITDSWLKPMPAARIVVPRETLSFDDDTKDVPFQQLSHDDQLLAVDEAHAAAQFFAEDYISRFGDGSGCADRVGEDAGHFAETYNEKYGDQNLARIGWDQGYFTDGVALAHNAALGELEEAWEETKESHRRFFNRAKEHLEDAGVDLDGDESIFDQSVMDLRSRSYSSDLGMFRYYMSEVFSAGANRITHLYCTAPHYGSVRTPEDYATVRELVEEEGAFVCVIAVDY